MSLRTNAGVGGLMRDLPDGQSHRRCGVDERAAAGQGGTWGEAWPPPRNGGDGLLALQRPLDRHRGPHRADLFVALAGAGG